MRLAQRGGSIPEQTQQVEVVTGRKVEEVGVKIDDMVARYAIKVVALSVTPPTAHEGAVGIVVFEEE